MNKKTIWIFFIFFIVLMYSGCKRDTKVYTKPEKRLPNIVIFLADDMTWRDCEPYGNPDVQTPHIQKLAQEGISFDNMFTSTAMCAPTRQQLMTGLFPVRSGAFPNHSKVYDGIRSFAHYFGELGYRVALIGKQHYGPDSSFPMEYLGGRQHDDGKNGLDIHLEEVLPVINDERPFFLIVAQNQPHGPWNRGNPEKYRPEALEIPEYMVDVPETRKSLTKYYAEITYMDSLLGKTLKLIDQVGKTNNTLSIFTSEQGYYYPFGKWTCYDLGLKTAFIVKWPGKIEPNTRNKAISQYVDVVPTLLDAVGVNHQDIDTGISDANGYRGFDGKSFLPVLLGQTQEHRKWTYGVQTTRGIFYGPESYPVRSVRSERYRYIQNLSYDMVFTNMITDKHSIYQNWLSQTKGQEQEWVKKYQNRPYEEFYDLEKDPFEKKNLAMNPEMITIKKEMEQELQSWMRQQGDKGLETELEALERQHLDKKEHPALKQSSQ